MFDLQYLLNETT